MTRDLAISCQHIECVRLLSPWDWLVPHTHRPLMVGIFGDWILADASGAHWHLDLLEGRLHEITRSSAAFNVAKESQENREAWFGEDWAIIAQSHGLNPGIDECLGWRIHPILGGTFAVDNIDVFPLMTYQTVTAALFKTLKR